MALYRLLSGYHLGPNKEDLELHRRLDAMKTVKELQEFANKNNIELAYLPDPERRVSVLRYIKEKFPIRDVEYGPGGPDGPVVESDTDLCAKFNGPRPEMFKFARIASETVLPHQHQQSGMSAAEAARGGYEAATTVAAPPKIGDLDLMTVKQLQELAESEEIDLKGQTRKEEIVKIIREAVS